MECFYSDTGNICFLIGQINKLDESVRVALIEIQVDLVVRTPFASDVIRSDSFMFKSYATMVSGRSNLERDLLNGAGIANMIVEDQTSQVTYESTSGETTIRTSPFDS